MSEGAAHTIHRLERELLAERVENDKLRKRILEHEQFRHQHRDCDVLAIAIQQARLILNAAQSATR